MRFVDQSENTRSVRLILLRGASKTILEKNGRKPIDLISEIRNQEFAKDVRRMLSPPGALDCLMLSPPTRLIRKTPKNLAIFVILFLGVILIEIFITLPYMAVWQIIINAISTFTCLICLALSVGLDPGYITRDKTDFLHLLEAVECTQLCADCFTIRTTRSKHCSVCNRCVERFDHHCPWINNCVGAKNHKYFIIFVQTMFSTVAIVFVQGFQALINVTQNGYAEAIQTTYRISPISVSVYAFYLFVCIQILISGFFFVPVFWLGIV